MSMRWTQEQLEAHLQTNGRIAAGVAVAAMPAPPRPKPAKYRNKRATVDGITFDSILEADYYVHLKLLKAAGVLKYFLMQVPIRLEGGVRLRVDFVPCFLLPDDHERVEYHDCKGMPTPAAINKIKQAKDRHGIEVKLIKRGSF